MLLVEGSRLIQSKVARPHCLHFKMATCCMSLLDFQFEVMRASGRFAEIAVRVVLGINI